MAKTQIPLKFKQIATDNFPNIPDDSLIIPLMAIAGTAQEVSTAAVKSALSWLETHGEGLEVKEGVTPGKGLKRLKSCLMNAIPKVSGAIAQSQTTASPPPKKATPKPVKKKLLGSANLSAIADSKEPHHLP